MRFTSIIALVASVLLLRDATSSAAQIPSSRVPDGLGVNIHFDHPQPGEFDMLLAAGFRISRTDILWNQSELKRGEYDFSRWDELFALYDKHHVRALCPLLYTNPLYDDNLSPHSDEGVAAFAKWAAAAVEHFKGRGVMWEIYNEPNNVFWRPQPDVNAYIKLALATAREIRKVAPDEMSSAPPSPVPTAPGSSRATRPACSNTSTPSPSTPTATNRPKIASGTTAASAN
jgi:hypothetical protein